MREVIRQITACVTFLPLLDCVCEYWRRSWRVEVEDEGGGGGKKWRCRVEVGGWVEVELQGSFDLQVYTHKDTKASEKWIESPPCFIANSQEVRLKSFSTSIQRVDTCVSYKMDD
ncbi:Mitotic spindle assembly checkpoint protein MAD2A [Portunus trituberculatus]|uniref:Mitotic spindle assembly checkpoint protein MAD2A n=1 Tax=Portunus trituberculatus TaxID=210409 RepID=A0A5B7H0M7_PORTR|nr:Mitotic spindle assembly checkpoint protein MAD2A [Portunus trituberculatus]